MQPTAKALWGSAINGIPPGRMRALRISAAKAACNLPTGAALTFCLQCSPQGWRQDPLVVATGGDARTLYGDDELINRIIEDLELRGIALTARNALTESAELEE